MLVKPQQVSSFRFSTAGLPAHERHNAIRQLRERGILPIEPLPDNVVSVQINKCVVVLTPDARASLRRCRFAKSFVRR